jgi:hypothetical protein
MHPVVPEALATERVKTLKARCLRGVDPEGVLVGQMRIRPSCRTGWRQEPLPLDPRDPGIARARQRPASLAAPAIATRIVLIEARSQVGERYAHGHAR